RDIGLERRQASQGSLSLHARHAPERLERAAGSRADHGGRNRPGSVEARPGQRAGAGCAEAPPRQAAWSSPRGREIEPRLVKPRRLSLFTIAGLLACGCFIPSTNATALTIVRYLDGVGDGSDVPVAQMKASTPTDTTLANYDPARDAFPGLWIQKGGIGVGESNPTKYQLWRAPAAGFTLNGAVSNTIWTAMQNFDVASAGQVVAYLVECNPDGSGSVAIDSVTVTRPDWDVGNTGTWIQDTFDFGIVNYTLGPGKSVGFKIMVGAASAGDMWFAYDTASYPALGQLMILAPGNTVTPTSGLTTTEGGGTATFTVVLDSQPSANVTIGLSSNDLTEGTVSPASLTFTPGNWNVAQTVTV